MSDAANLQHSEAQDDPLNPEQFTPGELPGPHHRPSLIHFIFIGPQGLRPGWGLLIFMLIFAGFSGITAAVVQKVHPTPVKTAQQRKAEGVQEQRPAEMLIIEGVGFSMIALTSWIMARIERRPIGRYGLGGHQKIKSFSIGFLWGLLFLTALVGTLWKLRLLAFNGRLLFGAALWRYAGLWLLGFVLVGLLEEYMLRGYLQYTIARGAASLYAMLFDTRHSETLGFWTAAAGLSFVFGFGHGNNPGESVIGLWSAGLIGMIFCLTLWKTGSLWWALGFHASWDWAQSFLFGVADSGTMVQGHLLASHPTGKLLLSGGATGPEGSALILPVLALLTVIIVLTLPKRRWSIEGESS